MSKLSEKERERLRKLAARPDDDIDFSDIPEITEFSAKATVGKFYRPIKERVTVRMDADVLEWLKSGGEGYQTRMNDYLRRVMYASRQQRTSAKKRAHATKKSKPKTVTV